MPQQWICNVIATVVGAPFVNWVKARVNERNAEVVKEKNLAIAMDPDIAAAFHASNAVSVSNTGFLHLNSNFLPVAPFQILYSFDYF